MAKMIVEIKSKDMIKPSLPTPNHLKTLQFSFIDQFALPVHMPLIFYYHAPTSQNADDLLKSSLSTTLVQFYPLAGRIQGNISINCNDEGLLYCVADVSSSLAEVIQDPNAEELLKLLPFAPITENKSIVAGVQVNHFRCGGMAVSLSISHKIADGTTFAAFFKAWAANAGSASKRDNVSQLKFDAASLFPPLNLDGIYDPELLIRKERTVTRRLIFDKHTIDRLREQCVVGQQVKAVTRTKLVSAFLWKRFLNIAKAKPTAPKILRVSLAVNLRAVRMSPIPGDCFGNLVWSAFTHTSIETETKYPEAVAKLSTAVKQIDESYISKLQRDESLLELLKAADSMSDEVKLCHISSCIRLPVYEVDFGWGTPVWVSMTTLPFKNNAIMLSTKCGQGIEAWVTVLEQDVDAFEQDHRSLSLASHSIRPKL